MQQSAITLRNAEPTLDEGRAFARYLDQAAEGFFRFMLGRRVEDILAQAFTQPDHDLSYQNVTFAEREGLVVGMASGYTAEQHRRSSDQPLEEAAGFHLRMMAVATLCAPLLRALGTVDDGDFYLQAIAVDEKARGQGVGSLLIDAIEERAKAGGATHLALDVSAGNDGARRLYERLGLSVVRPWPKHLPLPGLRVLRMAKPL